MGSSLSRIDDDNDERIRKSKIESVKKALKKLEGKDCLDKFYDEIRDNVELLENGGAMFSVNGIYKWKRIKEILNLVSGLELNTKI